MGVQWGCMKLRRTALWGRLDSARVLPFWSVSRNPGAALAGTGDRPIRLIVGSETLAGMPEGRCPARAAASGRLPATTTVTSPAMTMTATAHAAATILLDLIVANRL